MNLTIDIAGLTVGLGLPSGPTADRLRARYTDFLTEARPALSIETRLVEGAQFIPFQPGPWVIGNGREDGRVPFRSYQEQGWADLRRGTGSLELAPEADPENFLRVLSSWLALENDGLLLHA